MGNKVEGWVYYTSVKPTECTTPSTNLNENYELWVIMMYQCRFVDCHTWSTLVGYVNEGVYTGGREHMGNLCTFCSVLLWTCNCSKIEHLLKKKNLKKRRVFWYCYSWWLASGILMVSFSSQIKRKIFTRQRVCLFYFPGGTLTVTIRYFMKMK